MDLLPIFQWCEETGLGRTIRESVWAFAVVESVHLLALAMLGGAVLLVDLRLLNLGLRQRSLQEVAAEARPFMNGGLLVLVLSGIGLFASEAVKCYYSYPFSVKIATLVVAVLFTFTVRRQVLDSADSSDMTRKAVAVVSVALWFVVAAAGRWIGFSG